MPPLRWHISATRYEIAFMIILESYRDKTNFPGDSIVWWHISATRYEIAIMIILENYCNKTNFPGNSMEIAKCFTIKISQYL